MGILLKYVRSNIKSNKARIPLIILCLAGAVLMFFLSLGVIKVFDNYSEVHRVNTIIIENSSNSYILFGSLTEFPEEVEENAEYVATIFAAQGTVKDENTGVTVSANILATDYEDLVAYGEPNYINGQNLSNLGYGQIIIGNSMAEQFGLSVGAFCTINYSGTNYSLRVVAIAEDEGDIFEATANGNVIVSRSSMNEIIGFSCTNLFNICDVKMQDPSLNSWAVSLLSETYPSFRISDPTQASYLDETVRRNKIPFSVSAFVVCVYCTYIIYLTMKLVFGERVKQFSTMKSIGASNKDLFSCLMAESLLYGAIGGLIGTSVGFILRLIIPQFYWEPIFYGITFKYYLLAFLFGLGMSVVGALIPAIVNVRKSIRQTMVDSRENKKFDIISQVVGLLLFTTAVVAVIVQKQGDMPILSTVFTSIAVFGAVLLIPYFLNAIVKFGSRMFKQRNFSFIYLKNSFHSKNLMVIPRVLVFALFLVVFLVSLIASGEQSVLARFAIDDYNMQIANIGDGNESIEDYLYSVEIGGETVVDKVYLCTLIEEVSIKDTGSLLNKIYGYDIDDIKYLYDGEIIGDDAIEKLQSGGDYLLLNVQYNYVNHYQIGDSITFTKSSEIPDGETTFEIAGFVDTLEDDANMAITSRQILSGKLDVNKLNTIFFKINNTDLAGQVVALVRSNYSTVNYVVDASPISVYDVCYAQMELPLKLFNGYIGIVVGLSTLCVIVALLLALKQSSKEHKTMNLLGMSRNKFVNIFMLQIFFVFIATSIIATLMFWMLTGQIQNIFFLFKAYIPVNIIWMRTIIVALVCGISILIASLVMSWRNAKKFCNQSRIAEE